MAPSRRLINRQSGRNRNLIALATLIVILSIWSILGSHVFVVTNNISSDSRHLQSPNRLQPKESNHIDAAGKAIDGGSQKLGSDSSQFELSRGKKLASIDAPTRIDSTPKDAPPQEKSKPNNSQLLYNPPLPTNTSRRLLTYTRHGGRLNNQIIQFIGALQHATVLKRKLIIPDEKVAVEWTGLLDDNFEIWDLSSLKQMYDIDWDLGLDYARAEKEKVLHSQIPKECVLTKVQLESFLNSGIDHWREWDEKCPDIMSLGRELPLCSPKHSFCGDTEAKSEAYKIYQHLKLSPYMQSLLPPPQPLSVHSRRAGEGGYDWELCTGPTKTICTSHIERKDWNKYCNERTLRGNCAVWTDLSYAIKSKRLWKEDEKQYRFNLASDGTHDWSIDYDGQFTMANSTPWLLHIDEVVYDKVINRKESLQSLGRSFFIKERLQNKEELLSKSHGIMYQLSSTILEMFSLVNAEYFVGGFYSTLSLNVCLLRGLHRIMESNMCWMLIHPNSRYAIPPPMDQTVNIPGDSGQNESIMPPALMSDVEHAFVSNGNFFFVIDRYRFMYRKPGVKGKIPTYIAVLGQGEVPMTIETQIGGEDIIHANFTCSMGKQKDSRASVYILKDDDRNSTKDVPTLFIVCDDLKYDNDVTIQAPLILQSPDGSFSVSIGSHLVGPRNAPRTSWNGSMSTYAILVCLMPSDEDIKSDLLESYLKHHESLGVRTHIDIYNVNWHSSQLQSILNDYRSKSKFVSRHDWSSRAKSKSSAADIFQNSLTRPAAKMDCMLRSRGVDEYALFGDIRDMIDKTVDTQLKACQVNNNERCHISINTSPSAGSVLKHDKHERECVNIKSIEIAPWTLI